MSETASRPEPLTHRGADRSDERLAAESASHLGRHPSLQLVAELLTRLREMQLPWWTPEHLRKAYGASERMGWLTDAELLDRAAALEKSGYGEYLRGLVD